MHRRSAGAQHLDQFPAHRCRGRARRVPEPGRHPAVGSAEHEPPANACARPVPVDAVACRPGALAVSTRVAREGCHENLAPSWSHRTRNEKAPLSGAFKYTPKRTRTSTRLSRTSPQPGNRAVRSILCVQIVQTSADLDASNEMESGCCRGCCHGAEVLGRSNGGLGPRLLLDEETKSSAGRSARRDLPPTTARRPAHTVGP